MRNPLLGAFPPAARASPIAIMLYYLFGHYRIVPRPPTGDALAQEGGNHDTLTDIPQVRKKKVIASLGADF